MILVRADASTALGTGHAMRCLALTQALRDRGAEVTLAAATLPAAIGDRVRAEGATVVQLDAPPASAADVAETLALAARVNAGWLVVDGYAFDDGYVDSVATERPVLLIDDWPRDVATPALLLNQNLYATPDDYRPLGMANRLLLGGAFALLRREYATVPPPDRPAGPIERVLVTLGGADPGNVTARVVAALVGLEPMRGAEVRVVIGAAHSAAEEVERAVRVAGFEVLRDVRDMLALQDWADVAIGAAGTTSLELAARGLPAIQAVLMDNQVRVAAEMERRGVALSAGEPDGGFETRLAAALDRLEDGTRGAAMGKAGRDLVDGRGAGRVAARLLETG